MSVQHPYLLSWWNDNPADPDRPTLDNPDVRRLAAAISPGVRTTDLGGVMSLNVRLDPARLLRERLPFLRLSEWLLAHPEAVRG